MHFVCLCYIWLIFKMVRYYETLKCVKHSKSRNQEGANIVSHHSILGILSFSGQYLSTWTEEGLQWTSEGRLMHFESKTWPMWSKGFWATVPSTTEDNLLLVFKEIFHNTNCTGSCDIWDYTVRTSLGPMLPGGHVLYMMKCDCKYWELWINTVVITHSVSSQSWKTSSSALTRHSLQSRRTNSSGSTRGSRFSLKRNVINNNEATMPDIFLNLILFKLSNLLSDCKSIP